MKRIGLLVLSLAIGLPHPVRAQGAARDAVPDITDCARAQGRNRYFCESTAWRAAEAETHRLVVEAQRAGPMWVDVRNDYEAWKRVRRSPAAMLLTIHADYEALAGSLGRLISATRELQAQAVGREQLDERCLSVPGLGFPTLAMKCRVISVPGIAAGLLAQMQRWDPPGGPDTLESAVQVPRSFSVVVLERDPPGTAGGIMAPADLRWRPVGWAGTAGAAMGLPVLSRGPQGEFITIPIVSEGSGGMTLDVVLRRSGPLRWREIDAQSWRRELDMRVPRSLTTKGNAALDVANLSGDVQLARPDDPNASPTGGRAEVSLTVRDDVLVIDGVTFTPGTKPTSSRMPARFPKPPRKSP